MIVNGQTVVADYLRALPEVDRVVAHPPDGDKRSTPWVMLTLLSAPQDPNSRHDHLVEFYFQIDCYAGSVGGLPEVWPIAVAVRDALVYMPQDQDEAVVTRTLIRGFRYLPDTALEPARDRYTLTASCWMHPTPVAA
jgi:hypothetical protein